MRLIDADVLIKIIQKEGILGSYHSDTERENDVIDMIDKVPTINPVKCSHWEWGGKTGKDLYCVQCGYVLPRKCNEFAEGENFKFCPHCGCFMNGTSDS